jgi:hypothetical protein
VTTTVRSVAAKRSTGRANGLDGRPDTEYVTVAFERPNTIHLIISFTLKVCINSVTADQAAGKPKTANLTSLTLVRHARERRSAGRTRGSRHPAIRACISQTMISAPVSVVSC